MKLSEILTCIFFDEWDTVAKGMSHTEIRDILASEGQCMVWKSISELSPFPPPRPRHLRICAQKCETVAAIISKSGSLSVEEERKAYLWDQNIRITCGSTLGGLQVTVWGKSNPLQHYRDWQQERLAMTIHGLDAVASDLPAWLKNLQDVSFYDVLADKFEAGLSFEQISARRGINPMLIPLVFATAGNILGDFKKTYGLGRELVWLPLIEFKPLAEDRIEVEVINSGDLPGVALTIGPANGVGTARRHELTVGSSAAASALAELLQRLSTAEVVIDAPEALLDNRETLLMVPIRFQGTITATHKSGDTGRGDMWVDTVEFTISEAKAANLKVEWLNVDRKFHPQEHSMNLAKQTLRLPDSTRAHVHGIILPPDRLVVTAVTPIKGEDHAVSPRQSLL